MYYVVKINVFFVGFVFLCMVVVVGVMSVFWIVFEWLSGLFVVIVIVIVCVFSLILLCVLKFVV